MFLKTRQLTHSETFNKENKNLLTLICDSVSGPANQGGLIRLADAFGLEKLIFCGDPVNLESPRLKRSSRNCERSVSIEQVPQILEILDALKEAGYLLIGLELTPASIPVAHIKTSCSQNTALVIGSERDGIQQDVLDKMDHLAYIPMYGNNSSMNVGHAAAIALYDLINKKKDGARI